MERYYHCLPGRVESYVYNEQRATVKPLIKKMYINGDIVELPILVNVPIIFPRTMTSGVVFPIIRGDGVLLLFADRSLERWYSSGDDVEPGDSRKFDLSDAVAIPGLYSFKQENIAENNDDLLIRHKGSKIRIKSSGVVEIQSGVTPLLSKDGVLTGNTLNPVTGSLFSANPADVSQKVRASHI
jgi:hypothetical protein